MELRPTPPQMIGRSGRHRILSRAAVVALASSALFMWTFRHDREIGVDTRLSSQAFTLSTRPAPADSLVVLTYAMSDVFACQEALQQWSALDRSRPGLSVQLELTEQPNDNERKRLALARWSRFSVRERRLGQVVRRREVLLVGGREVLVSTASTLGRRSPVLRAVAHGTGSSAVIAP
jgi:hypothetical protein